MRLSFPADKWLFTALMLSVMVVFFVKRPLNGSSGNFIEGDGLGYYSYLPATFIYDDHQYKFSWFNKVHDKYYSYSIFPNPEDNFMVDFKDRRINKYYQGLSFIWLPFFLVAHMLAGWMGYPADGFSLPYQNAVGIASLFYLLLGLVIVRKILLRMFNHYLSATIIPFAIFFGTHLFPFAVTVNSHTHLYSFTFNALFLLFIVSITSNPGKEIYFLTGALFALIITVCIRPLNGLMVLLVPAFISRETFKSIFRGKFSVPAIVLLIFSVAALFFQGYIMYRQTGSLLSYTYTGEKFYFHNPRFFESLISYHMGIFVWVPLIFISLFGIPCLPKKLRYILPAFFLLLLFIYSSWWFWYVVKRAMIDFYVVPAIWLGALAANVRERWKPFFLYSGILLSVLYYQFKQFQIHAQVLDEWLTTKEIFWRNFFRITRARIYPVPMSSVVQMDEYSEDFEKPGRHHNTTDVEVATGGQALLLDQNAHMAEVLKVNYPKFFALDGLKKVRLCFKANFESGVDKMHIFLNFRDGNDRVIKELPFYMNHDNMLHAKWDLYELGSELDVNELAGSAKVQLLFWNVDAKKRIFIDDVRLQFFLCDYSFETYK